MQFAIVEIRRFDAAKLQIISDSWYYLYLVQLEGGSRAECLCLTWVELREGGLRIF